MSEQDRSNEALVSLLAGLGLGVLIGAATALLMAPQSGAETRSTIGDTATDVLGRVRDAIDDVRVKLDEVIAQTKGLVSRRPTTGTETGAAELAPDGGAAATSEA